LNLQTAAHAHVPQWKYGTSDLSSPFLSASYSLAYALFEARRWNIRHRCTDTQISIIDTAEIPSDMWLATELVGATCSHAAWFARAAEELLIYHRIPCRAVVVTLSLDELWDFLPGWCADIKPRVCGRYITSTSNMVSALLVAYDHNKSDAQAAVMEQSVPRSLDLLLRLNVNLSSSEDVDYAVDKLAGVAAIFCWWTSWIKNVDPSAYPPMLERVRATVVHRLLEE
ncbi:hypothetical protein C8R46DRAFT_1070776, partial [Mycena filopes]